MLQYLCNIYCLLNLEGMTTLESPILPPFGLIQQLQLRFWVKGSYYHPVELTARIRTADGQYSSSTFLDLRQYGTITNTGWIKIVAKLPASEVPYQVRQLISSS